MAGCSAVRLVDCLAVELVYLRAVSSVVWSVDLWAASWAFRWVVLWVCLWVVVMAACLVAQWVF